MYLSYNVGTYIYILIYILSCNIRIGIQKEYQYTAWFGLQQYIRIYWYILHLCTCVHVHSSQHTTVTSQSTSFQLRTVKAGQTWQNTFSVVVNWPWRDCSWKHFPADTHTHTHKSLWILGTSTSQMCFHCIPCWHADRIPVVQLDQFGCEIAVEGASRRNILTHTHTHVSHLQQGTNWLLFQYNYGLHLLTTTQWLTSRPFIQHL